MEKIMKAFIIVVLLTISISLIAQGTPTPVQSTTPETKSTKASPQKETTPVQPETPVAQPAQILSHVVPPDFRKVKWGMTIAQAKATEPAKPIREAGLGSKKILVYEDQVAGLSCDVVYIFVKDKLVRAKYLVTSKHTNNNQYLSDFYSLAESLENKYGKPTSDNKFWKSDLYKDSPNDWGLQWRLGILPNTRNGKTLKLI